jgi:hypothetical protein
VGRLAWLGELRTTLTGVDPGLTRLRLAGTGTASMALAAGVMTGVEALTGLGVTLVLFAALLAMISNLAVNEPDDRRRHVTTALMLGPAAAAITAGTLLVPYRLVADAVFVAVMMLAVYVRRFGPRGFALGMAGFNAYFLTQFLQVQAAELPWLLVASAVGIGSTLVLRAFVFAERPERTLGRELRALRAHVHALVAAVADLLTADAGDVDARLRDVRRRQARLNDTALLVADLLQRQDTHGDLPMQVIDVELAAERLAVSSTRVAETRTPVTDEARSALLAGLHGLLGASATGTPPAMAGPLLDGAQRDVVALEGTSGPGDRVQRLAFAVTRLAIALGARPDEARGQGADGDEPAPEDEPEKTDETVADARHGMLLTTRQAVQVGVATTLAIVVGELVSPARWYWAVITAFIVFGNTSSRGDVLSQGWQRTIGTIGGVIAGMGLAVLVSGNQLAALVLLFACVFLMVYLARVSLTLMAFWLTAVIALLYGLIGQFSVATLLVRIEETAAGAVVGVLAGYLVLPKRTREAFGEAVDAFVDSVDATLVAAADRVLGRTPDRRPAELAREVHDGMAALRARAAPLDSPLPWRRGRSSYQRSVRVLGAVDYYMRSLARLSDDLRAPGWRALDPAVTRVRDNLDALRRALLRRDPRDVRSAEDVIDTAEAEVSHHPDPHRMDLLAAARLLRRIDQSVVTLATDLGVPGTAGRPGDADLSGVRAPR